MKDQSPKYQSIETYVTIKRLAAITLSEIIF